MNAFRAIYKYWSAVIAVGVLVQIGAAGYGAFYAAHKVEDKGTFVSHHAWDHGFGIHDAFGTILVGGMILLLLFGLAARLGKPAIWFPLALAIAGVIQILLAELGRSVPALGWLHPLNALFLAAVAGQIAARQWRKAPAATATA